MTRRRETGDAAACRRSYNAPAVASSCAWSTSSGRTKPSWRCDR